MPDFVPDDFSVPVTLIGDGFRLEPLGPEHNDRDYAAWVSSIDHIRATPGFPDGNWPSPMEPEENLADLERHARDFAGRVGFTYTVLDATDDVIGCVYIYPVNKATYTAEVSSWVRGSHAHVDPVLWRAVTDWLAADWPFVAVHYDSR